MKKTKKGMLAKITIFIKCAGVMLFVVAGYFSFSYIKLSFNKYCDFVSDISGFKIKKIEIIGGSPRVASMVRDSIQTNEGESIFKKSSAELYMNVKKIPWVKSAIVQKSLPNIVKLKITEATPIAIYQHNSKSTLIDEDGNFIEDVKEKPAGMPIISGINANKKAKEILGVIVKFEELKERLEILSFVRERRWDMTISGVQVKLPEKNLEDALDVLSILMKSGKINKNTVDSIDLRLPQSVVISGLKIKKATRV